MFHISDPRDIKNGRVTDVYFARTLEILKARGISKRVRAEFFAKGFADGWGWGVFIGVEEVARLMEGKAVNVRCLDEGEVFMAGEPVMEVEGDYQDICVFETALLGFICQSSGIGTKAARIRLAAGDRVVASFGARRMHPALAPMIERAAYIGGCDGVAVIVSAELLATEPMGTMPHALIIVLGDTVEALKAFDEVVDKGVKRVALIDTFNDEKFEALRVAEAAKEAGIDLFALRLDTPGSRRGDFLKIFEEVRWELDLRGFNHLKLFASGGLDEKEVIELKGVVDAFGVGTSISNAPVVDFSMDIVEMEGKALAKRGKASGPKEVTVCVECGLRAVVPLGRAGEKCGCGGGRKALMKPLIKDGAIVRELASATELRGAVAGAIKGLEL